MKSKINDEVRRLAGSPPLVTILKLMVGPLCSQITSALYGIINTIWVSKYVGETGMAAVATDIAWEGIARAFGLFLLTAASTQISALFGKEQFEECEQVICDLLRTAIIFGMIVPAILLPINKPLSRWFGANEETVEGAYQYMLPQCAGNVFTCIFLACCGFLQAEGRTMLVGIIDICALGIGMGALNPFFLGVLKMGVKGPSVSTIIADGVPGITLTILYFCGVFGVKPKLRGLLRPYSKHTINSLLVGSSQFMSQVSMCIPGIIVRKLIGVSVSSAREYDLAMSGFNVLCRYSLITTSVVLAFCSGYLPPASYAYAAQKWKRYLRLSIHLVWVSAIWCFVTTIFPMAVPVHIALIFGKGDDYLRWSKNMLMASNALSWILFTRFNFQTILQAQQRGGRAMIISFTSNFVAVIAFSFVLYYTNRNDAARLMYVYPISYGIGCVLGTALLIKPFWDVIKKSRDEGEPKKLEEIPDYNADSEEESDNGNKECRVIPEL